MNREIEKYWVWLGIFLGVAPYFKLLKPPTVNLEVLSIFFGGLLAIASILPATNYFKKMNNMIRSGHVYDLINYIRLPLYFSLILIFIDVIKSSLLISVPAFIPPYIIQGIILSIWGVFSFSLIRILTIIPHLLTDIPNKTP